MKNSLKYILSIGHAYAYYFSKIFIKFYRIRQENTNLTVSFPGVSRQNSIKVFQNPARISNCGVNFFEWLVGLFLWIIGSLRISVKYQTITQKEDQISRRWRRPEIPLNQTDML